MKIAIVTCSTNPARAAVARESWEQTSSPDCVSVHVMMNGPVYGGYLGTVPAFRAAVDRVLQATDADIIACLHDDLIIYEQGWDEKVIRYFSRDPRIGLLGFGGAKGLGALDLYHPSVPYNPMLLARSGFRSNLTDAETHGMRSLLAERVACLDGFSQIGRRAFWEGYLGPAANIVLRDRPWTILEDLGFMHHFYDGALGCLAKRHDWQVWYIPVSCTHKGGQTAVGDPGYQEWAKTKIEGGDRGFWEQAHQIGYKAFRDVLPIRT